MAGNFDKLWTNHPIHLVLHCAMCMCMCMCNVHCRMWYQKVERYVCWHHKRKDTLAGTRLCSFAQWQFWWTNDVESGKNKKWRGLNRGNFNTQHTQYLSKKYFSKFKNKWQEQEVKGVWTGGILPLLHTQHTQYLSKKYFSNWKTCPISLQKVFFKIEK